MRIADVEMSWLAGKLIGQFNDPAHNVRDDLKMLRDGQTTAADMLAAYGSEPLLSAEERKGWADYVEALEFHLLREQASQRENTWPGINAHTLDTGFWGD